jgi:formylglycine-generating enzyme required for sulfatase activity
MLDVAVGRDDLILALDLLAVDRGGRPTCADAEAVIGAVVRVHAALGPADAWALLETGLLRHSDDRYAELVAPHMVDVEPAPFVMGTPVEGRRHFCGEVPAHPVELSSFRIGACPVTNALWSVFDPDGAVTAGPPHRPAVGLTWFDTALLALWLGCRLPTEAEWEFACGAGSAAEWCCGDENDLHRYAWYCRNSDGSIHDVGTREPNGLGVHDLHGNVWEWCADTYDADFYASSPLKDPLKTGPPANGLYATELHAVSRGGSMQSLSEMCRTRFRFHEPRRFWAADLGFRLARGSQPDREEPLAWLP